MTTSSMLKAAGAAALAVAMSTSIALADTTFSDVPTSHWAYAAIAQLQADGLIEGYPGGYFKGNRPLTRYELAVAVARLDKSVKDKLATLQTVTPADLAVLQNLETEFKGELVAVEKDLAGVKSDVATLKTQVAAQQATLDRQKFKLYYFLRAPGTFKDYVAAYNAAGLALPANTQLAGPLSKGAQSLKSGLSGGGTGYQVVRIRFDGVVDPKVSYSIRIEDLYYLSNAPGIGALGTSSDTPSFGTMPNNSSFRLSWANLTYKDPSGIYATVGRFSEASGDIGLAFSDQFNGAELGYAKGKLATFVGYSFNKASVSNTTTVTNSASQTLFARAQINATKKLTVGASWIDDLSFFGGLTGYNPATGLLAPSNPNIAIGSLDAIYGFTPKFSLEAEAIQRFGKDPFTGDTWDGKNAYWVKAFLGDTAPKSGNSYIDAGYIYAGLNSTGPRNAVSAVPDYQSFFIGNPNGYQIGYAGAHYFFGSRSQVGLVWQGYQLKKDLPVNITAGPLAGTAGNYLHKDDAQAFFLETKVSF